MPTLYSGWQAGNGTTTEARIKCVYDQNYSDDHTQVHFNVSYWYTTSTQVDDTSNNWEVTGDNGSASGSNIILHHAAYPTGGETQYYFQYGGWRRSNANVASSVWNVSAQDNIAIVGNFTLETGALAPFVSSTPYATNITPTSFTTAFNANGNGGTLTDTTMRINTSPSETGATQVTKGSFGNITYRNLLGGLTYYFKVAVANNTYGWGPWSEWVSVTTLPAVQVNVGGAWKYATPYVKVNGVWKQADRWVKVGGVWKR